ncbi:MAG: CRISPR-associated endonuclease Cas2 [Rugosibacter sp.]|nr:MAG: CRISPR-associated endonuclease Cas2 [Rugosibacter sp.]TBR10902.1 MAG: CRISPR-associated endonuclease Cas2 [Rugosibacter sp.]
MLVIVCYDVNTETREGRRRLRRVARVCEGVGQRVQKSVFEFQIDLVKMEELERRLLAEIKPEEDNLRLYRLAESRGCEVREHGVFKATDFDGPLVL